MPQVDFYVLTAQTEQSRLAFTARLCERALHSGLEVRILTASAEASNTLSQALWSAKPESFIPHAVAGQNSPNAPVHLSHHHEHCAPAPANALLINLGAGVPDVHAHYSRVAEVVVQTPDVLAQTRSHYAQYKQSNYPLNTHKIGQ